MKPLLNPRVALVVIVALLVIVVPTNAQEDEAPTEPKWGVLNFGSQIESGAVYSIEKLVLDVPTNDKQVCYGPVKGVFVDKQTSFDKLEITDRNVLERLELSFGSFFRLRQRGVTSYGQLGTITVLTNNGQFKITISELGFNLGVEYPSEENTFYSWTLAKILDDEAKGVGSAGLNTKHFNVLSGIQWIESARFQYEKMTVKSGEHP